MLGQEQPRRATAPVALSHRQHCRRDRCHAYHSRDPPPVTPMPNTHAASNSDRVSVRHAALALIGRPSRPSAWSIHQSLAALYVSPKGK